MAAGFVAILATLAVAAFLLFFAALWLAVTTLLAVLSGWLRLAARYPDRSDEPLLRMRGSSGTMGLGVNLRGVLTLSACRAGLRVGIMRLLGPFCRDFLVPWDSITVARKRVLFRPVARLEFGRPAVGALTISAAVADRLAEAAGRLWPEPGTLSAEGRSSALG